VLLNNGWIIARPRSGTGQGRGRGRYSTVLAGCKGIVKTLGRRAKKPSRTTSHAHLSLGGPYAQGVQQARTSGPLGFQGARVRIGDVNQVNYCGVAARARRSAPV
jgi:hypothetical protein